MDNSSVIDKARDVWKWERHSISKLIECIDSEAFSEVVQTLFSCSKNGKKVLVSGCGTSGTAARKACNSLCSVDVPAFYITPGDGMHATMGTMQSEDILVLFSKGGNRHEMLELLDMAKNKRIKVIACTSNPASPLAIKSDVMLLVNVDREADESNSLATSSTIAMIAAFDAVAVTIKDCL